MAVKRDMNPTNVAMQDLTVRAIKGLHDEALSGEWKGHRSSRLGLQWRVIYRVVASVLSIQVVQVTPHDYRRP